MKTKSSQKPAEAEIQAKSTESQPKSSRKPKKQASQPTQPEARAPGGARMQLARTPTAGPGAEPRGGPHRGPVRASEGSAQKPCLWKNLEVLRKLLGASKVGFKVRASEHIHQDGGGIGNPRKLLSDQMGFLGSY